MGLVQGVSIVGSNMVQMEPEPMDTLFHSPNYLILENHIVGSLGDSRK